MTVHSIWVGAGSTFVRYLNSAIVSSYIHTIYVEIIKKVSVLSDDPFDIKLNYKHILISSDMNFYLNSFIPGVLFNYVIITTIIRIIL